MPIYPYICGACGHEYDKLQKVSDEPDRECPECGKETVRRKVTAAAFHLKGTGWYVTDFRDKGTKKDKEDGKGKGEEKGDTKAKTDDKKSDSKATDSTSSTSTGKESSAKSESTKTDSN